MHTVKRFQILLLTLIINNDNNPKYEIEQFYFIDRSLTGTTTPGQGEPESSDNKRVLQNSKKGTLPSDAV